MHPPPRHGWGRLGAALQRAPLPQGWVWDRALHPPQTALLPGMLPAVLGPSWGSQICLAQKIGAGGDSETHPAPRDGGRWGMEMFSPWRCSNFSGQGGVVSVVPLLALTPDWLLPCY